MNKLKVIFKKIKFKLFALLGLLTVGCGCLIFTNNSYAWFVNEDGNLESENQFRFVDNAIDTYNDVTFSGYEGDSYFKIEGSISNSNNYYWYVNLFSHLVSGKTYTLSFTNVNNLHYDFWDGGTSYHSQNGVLTINLTDYLKNSSNYFYFFISTNSNITLPLTINIMINEGSSVLPYLPYGIWYSSTNYNDLQEHIDNLQQDIDNLRDNYTLLQNQYNQLNSDYTNLHIDYESSVSQLNEYQDTINRLNTDITTLTNLVNDLRHQIENNFTWQSLFFSMADTPFRVVANVLGFNIFGINLFTTFIGLTTTLAIIFLIKKFI